MYTDNSALSVKNYYEEWTDKYLEDFGLFFQAQQAKNPKDIIKNLFSVIPFFNGMNILDAGCGVGGPAITLANMKKVTVEAITISPKQVAYANSFLSKKRWLKGKVNFKEGDFHMLTNFYKKNEFDVVYFMESLVHSHNPNLVIEQVSQVLKSNGYLYIKDLFKGPVDPNNPSAINFPINATNTQFCLKIQLLGDIINILTENGFRILKCGVPSFKEDFSKGNNFTAKHLFKLLEKQNGPWVDKGYIFLHWLEIVAQKHY